MASPTTPISLAPESQPETASSLAPPPCGPASIVRCMSIRPVPPLVPPKADRSKSGAIWNNFLRNRSRPRLVPSPLTRPLHTVIPAKAGIQRAGGLGWMVSFAAPSAAAGMGDSLLQCRRGNIAVLPGLRCECVASLLIGSEHPAMRSHKKQQFASIFGETPVRPGAPTRGRSPALTPPAGGPRR